MISVRFVAMVSTVLLVVGALLVGEALHGGVVTRTYYVWSPWVVLRAALGLVFIALGYRLQTPVEEYVDMPSGEPDRPDRDGDEPSDASTGEFDADVSPLGGDGLEHVDAEESDAEFRDEPSEAEHTDEPSDAEYRDESSDADSTDEE